MSGWVGQYLAKKSLPVQPEYGRSIFDQPLSHGQTRKTNMEEFYIVRARGDDVLLRLLRMMREGRIDMKPLNRMDDAELYRTVSIWFDPTSTTSVFSWEST